MNDNIRTRESQGEKRDMSELRRDLLLHPERLRIIQVLLHQPMAPREIHELLGDVAQATMYRHINQLEEGGLIEVVAERRKRGGTERTFRVVERAVSLGEADLSGATPAEHFRYFATFLGTLLADYAAYLERNDPDLVADRVGYQKVPLWLTDTEFDELAAELRTAVHSRREREPAPGRRRRLVTSIVMPDDRTANAPVDDSPGVRQDSTDRRAE